MCSCNRSGFAVERTASLLGSGNSVSCENDYGEEIVLLLLVIWITLLFSIIPAA